MIIDNKVLDSRARPAHHPSKHKIPWFSQLEHHICWKFNFFNKKVYKFKVLNLHKDSDWLLFTPFWTCSASIDRKHLRHSNKTQRIRHWRIKNHSHYEHLAAIQSLYICGWCGLSRGGSVGCWCTFKCRLRVNINNNGNNNDFLVFVSNVGSIFRISNISNVIYF